MGSSALPTNFDTKENLEDNVEMGVYPGTLSNMARAVAKGSKEGNGGFK